MSGEHADVLLAVDVVRALLVLTAEAQVLFIALFEVFREDEGHGVVVVNVACAVPEAARVQGARVRAIVQLPAEDSVLERLRVDDLLPVSRWLDAAVLDAVDKFVEVDMLTLGLVYENIFSL